MKTKNTKPPTGMAVPPVETPRRGGEWIVAAAILAGLTLLAYGDVLFSAGARVGSAEQGDVSLYFAPHWSFGFGELARGNFDLSNPHAFSGAPSFGGFQVSLLYSFNLMYLILPLRFALI